MQPDYHGKATQININAYEAKIRSEYEIRSQIAIFYHSSAGCENYLENITTTIELRPMPFFVDNFSFCFFCFSVNMFVAHVLNINEYVCG